VTLSAWLGREATIDEVKGITIETVKAIYTQEYYMKPKLNKLPDSIQGVMLDAAVNSGPGRAIKILQQVLNDAGYGPLTVDGSIGPQSLAAAAKAETAMGGEAFCRALVERRRAFMQQLAVKDPTQQRFVKGWMARCDQLETEFA
jgi:lysozyme family protein